MSLCQEYLLWRTSLLLRSAFIDNREVPPACPASVNYYALKGHMIVLPQDAGPLLTILPGSDLRLNDVIKVFWMGKSLPSTVDLKPVLRVRKDKVLAALFFLVQHILMICTDRYG